MIGRPSFENLRNSLVILDRPLLVRPRLSAWLVMGFALYLGYDSYQRNFRPEWFAFNWNPGGNHGANYRTYHHAAELALEGKPFYDVPPPGLDAWAVYLYPPITVVAYYPFTLGEWLTGYWILIGLNAIAGLAAAMLIVRFIERSGRQLGWVDVGLVFLLFLFSPFSFGTIYYGNINILLTCAFVIGFLALEDGRETLAGLSFGLAALWKVFPALVGVWLLQRRAWRAIGMAIGVGGGGLLAGVAVFGWKTTYRFFFDVLMGRAETTQFVRGYPPDGRYYITLQRPLSHLVWAVWPSAPIEVLTPVTLVVATGLLAVFYYRASDRLDTLFAIFATVVVTVTLIPALQWYLVLLYFPMIPLLYEWDGPGRIPFVVGALVLFINERPGGIIEWVDTAGFPAHIEFLATLVFSVATVQLYAILLMLAACAYCKYSDVFDDRCEGFV